MPPIFYKSKVSTTPAAIACLCCSMAAMPVRIAAEPFDSSMEIEAVYTGDIWTNLAGGVSRGSAYLDNLDLTVRWDPGPLPLLGDTEFFLYGLYNNGRSFAADIVGDLQALSNIETGVQAVRLYEAWLRFDVGRRGNLLFGLYDLNSEFDALDAAQLFLNSAHGIGTDISQSGLNGPSIFPVTSLSLRYAFDLDDRWAIRIAVLDGVPGLPEEPEDTTIRISQGDGALVIGEVERRFEAAKMLFGAWGYTAEFSTDPLDTDADARMRRGNVGAYLRGEAVVFDGNSRVSAFGRLGVAHGDFNPFGWFLGGGMTWQGAFAARPDDEFGIAIAWAETSDHVMRLADDAGVQIEAREIAVELTYSIVVADRVRLQPNLQYIFNPGLDPQLDNAFAAGLRFVIDLWPG